MASTEEFTQRPKLSFDLALPSGAESIAESIAEYLDVAVGGERRTVIAPADDVSALDRGLSA